MKFNKGASDEGLKFPLTELPTKDCGLHSPKIGRPNGLPAPNDPSDIIAEVLAVRASVARREWPKAYAEKHGLGDDISELLWRGADIFDSEDAAMAVHMDKPLDLFFMSWEWLKANGVQLKPEFSEGPWVSFLTDPIGVMAAAAANIDKALNTAFEAKYFFGQPRPEEIVGYNMTAYPEGCPPHPAYPAGHGAVAGATCATIETYFDLTEEQAEMVRLSCRQFAHFRTFAGVHYAEDNEAGLIIGYYAAASDCAGFLA